MNSDLREIEAATWRTQQTKGGDFDAQQGRTS